MKKSLWLSFLCLFPLWLSAKEKALVTVKIEENWKWHGRVIESPIHICQYMITQYLLLHGFDVASQKESKYFRKRGFQKLLQRVGYSSLEEWRKSTKTRAPKFIIEGKAFVKPKRKSTFYGSTVAFIYEGKIEITLKDRKGKVLEKITASLEYGKPNRDKYSQYRAAKGCLKNLALIVCAYLYKNPEFQKYYQCDRSKLEKRLKVIEEEFRKLKGTVKTSRGKAEEPSPKKEPEEEEEDDEGPF